MTLSMFKNNKLYTIVYHLVQQCTYYALKDYYGVFLGHLVSYLRANSSNFMKIEFDFSSLISLGQTVVEGEDNRLGMFRLPLWQIEQFKLMGPNPG